MSRISAATLQAYRETEYLVHDTPPFVLRVGVASPALLACHARHDVGHSAFITACNPGSRLLPAEENAARLRSLAATLQRQQRVFLPGVGRHPQGGWPGEESFLVLGLSAAEACRIGIAYQQHAILWCGADAVPHLLLLA